MSESNGHLFTREAFGKSAPRRFREVPLPAAGGLVRIRNLTSAEMRTFRKSFANAKGEAIKSRTLKLNELLVTWCVGNAAGTRILNDDDALG